MSLRSSMLPTQIFDFPFPSAIMLSIMATQRLERNNRDRLVTFNHRLLTEYIGKSLILNNANRIVDIAQKDLRERVAMQIPQALLSELNLGEFHFRPVIEHALASLYEGSSRPRDDKIDMDKSEVLIEIINRVPHGTRNSRIPIFVRIAARHPRANRALEVAYDCQDGNLDSVIISISPNELRPPINPHLIFYLPSSFDNNASIISRAMKQQYERDEHMHGLYFVSTEADNQTYQDNLQKAGLHIALHRDKIVFVIAASGGALQDRTISVPRRLDILPITEAPRRHHREKR